MKVLVLNCGSSSIKYKLFDMTSGEVMAQGGIEKIGVKLTKLTPEQAAYIGVSVDGPYKADHYRY